MEPKVLRDTLKFATPITSRPVVVGPVYVIWHTKPRVHQEVFYSCGKFRQRTHAWGGRQQRGSALERSGSLWRQVLRLLTSFAILQGTLSEQGGAAPNSIFQPQIPQFPSFSQSTRSGLLVPRARARVCVRLFFPYVLPTAPPTTARRALRFATCADAYTLKCIFLSF